MIESFALSSTAQALSMVGLVLVEAIALYLGYGVMEERAAPIVFDAIKGK